MVPLSTHGPDATYNIPLAIRLHGDLDPDALQAALADVVARHESLRTIFPADQGRPYQCILPADQAAPHLVIESVTPADLAARLKVAAATAFDLSRNPPLRAWRSGRTRVPCAPALDPPYRQRRRLPRPVDRDLGRAYDARSRGTQATSRPCRSSMPITPAGNASCSAKPTIPAASWPNNSRSGGGGSPGWPKNSACPWITDVPGPPATAAAPSPSTWTPACTATCWPWPTTAALPVHGPPGGTGRPPQPTRRRRRHPHRNPTAGRLDQALEDLVGFFVNTLVLRTDLAGHPAFGQLVARVHDFDLAAYEHQDLPFHHLVEAVQPTRSLGRNPLFQVMLVLQNNHGVEAALPGLNGRVEESTPDSPARPHLPLPGSLRRRPDASGLTGALEYSLDLFGAPRRRRWRPDSSSSGIGRSASRYAAPPTGLVADPARHMLLAAVNASAGWSPGQHAALGAGCAAPPRPRRWSSIRRPSAMPS